MATPIWKNATVYQVYPRSFCDSNGDGIGDIPGIISKLDHIKELGAKIIWLSPVYMSPLDDMGYDISDYYSIHPDYGTMEDFDRLLAEAEKRGLKIVMDLVVNHTSDEHSWFKQSKDKDSPYHDYYYWRKGKDDNKNPPNNWTSMFTGPAWTYDEEVGEWYLHLYSKKQPDLNFHNPKVVDEVEKILNFYLNKGVYGFRCDVINQIYKESLEDGKKGKGYITGAEHYLMTEGNHRLLRKFYDDIFSKRECMVIGETYDVDIENGLRYLNNHELDMFFQFETMGIDQTPSRVFAKRFNPELLKNSVFKWQKAIPWNSNYLENHDQRRSITRFGDQKRYWKESGKALALFNLTLKGTPFVYEGQEIGMIDKPYNPPEESMDVACRTVNEMTKKMHVPAFIRHRVCHRLDRDHARTPMQWDASETSGFSTTTKTWVKLNPIRKNEINVETEKKDPSSIYHFYKALIHLREKTKPLHDGEFEEIKTAKSIIAFKRVCPDEETMTLLNLSPKVANIPSNIDLSNYEVLLSTAGENSIPKDSLRPYEGLLLYKKASAK